MLLWVKLACKVTSVLEFAACSETGKLFTHEQGSF